MALEPLLSKEECKKMLEENPQMAEGLRKFKTGLKCEHLFVVVSKKIADKSEHPTQIMCQKCLCLVSFQEVTRANENIVRLRDTAEELAESHKNDES